MPKAVRFDSYGGLDVLKAVDVQRPKPQAGQLLLRVKAAGINQGEVEVPIASTYPLDDVKDAYEELEGRRTHGKIVLMP